MKNNTKIIEFPRERNVKGQFTCVLSYVYA